MNRCKAAEEKLPNGKELMKNSCSSAVAFPSDNLIVIHWVNSQLVHTISTFAGHYPVNKAKRWDQKEKKYLKFLDLHIFTKWIGC